MDTADDIVVEAPASETDGAETQQLRDVIEALASQVAELTKKVNAPTPPKTLPLALTPKQRIKQMSQGETLKGRDVFADQSRRVDTFGLTGGFRPNDIVILINEEKLQLLRDAKGANLQEGEVLYGVVQSLMYARRRDRQRKYRVAFPTLGKSFDDGVMEYDMELQEAAA